MGDQAHVAKELVATCGSIEWQVLVFTHGLIHLGFLYNLAGVEYDLCLSMDSVFSLY